MSNPDGAGNPPATPPPPPDANEPGRGIDGSPAENGGLRRFIFYRELAEVYLLLDNVSASTHKSLPPPPAKPASGDADIGNAPAQTETTDWVEEICKIGWPPSGSNEELANEAATLIRARDLLNNLAAPASGATIAFTLLVAGEEYEPKTPGRKLSWWRRAVLRLAGSHPEYAPPPELPIGPGWDGKAPSRLSLANIAFPNLAKPARSFRIFSRGLLLGLTASFLLTSVLSWDIATGNALLKQLATLEAAEPAPAPASASAVTPAATEQLNVARENLSHWLDGWSWLGWKPTGEPNLACPVAKTASCPDVNEQWAAALLNVLGGAVLPICYGLLGAGAAVARSMATRIRESLLAPRHQTLFLMQLALGAVIGGCIGLFVTPTGGAVTSDTTPSGVLGSVPLSASALCFVAGFGVDGVFLALESLIGRVFNVPDPTKASSPAVPLTQRPPS
jgi:hypothetical protein